MTYLFFAPYNGIWQHALPEAIVARTLKESGLKINYLSCRGTLDQYCITMHAYGVSDDADTEQKKKICKTCIYNTQLLSKHNATKLEYIDEYLDESIQMKIQQSLRILDNQKNDPALTFQDDLIRFSAYSLILKHKITDKNQLLNASLFDQFRNQYKQVLLCYHAVMNYFKKNKITGVFTYNSFYPTNRAVALAAKKMNIPIYWMHAGSPLHNRLLTLNLGKGHHYDILDSWLAHWQQTYQKKPASHEGISEVTKHFTSLLEGKNIFVYSSSCYKSEGMHAYFKIPNHRKVILAVLSSQDERIAVEAIDVLKPQTGLCFETQYIWLQSLLDFAEKNQDLTVIIRVHPRDFPNRRESVLSQQALNLQKLFVNLPENVRVNWPEDNISLYQLSLITDVCLHAGSSVGKELSLLGIPTVNYMDNGLSYPFNLSYFANTKETYFQAIRQALERNWSFETARNAFRWSSLELFEGLWYIGENFEELLENRKLPFVKRVVNKIFPNFLKWLRIRTIEHLPERELLIKLLSSNSTSRIDFSTKEQPMSLDDEKQAIFKALDNLLEKMYKFVTHKDDFRLYEKIEHAKKQLNSSAG